MTFSLPISTHKAARPQPQNDTPVRVVPAPALKTFVMEVEWEETDAEPIILPVQINSVADKPSSLITKILRRTLPLEFRLDPTL